MNRRKWLIGGGGLALLGSGVTWTGLARSSSAVHYAEATKVMRAQLPAQPKALDLIRYAALAPNGHNAQPWQFALAPDLITIKPDLARRTPVVDPDDHHLFVSLGCAAENLTLAAAARGLRGEPRLDETDTGAIAFAYAPGPTDESALFGAIPIRQSTRAEYDGRSINPSVLRALTVAASDPKVDLLLVTDRPAMDRIRDLVVAGNSVQMADPAFVRELKSWLRFNQAQALQSGDGLYSVASGSPALPDWLGPLAFDWLSTVKVQNDIYAKHIRSSAGLAVFTGAKEDPEHWLRVGHACQRFALQATALGLKHAFINQPIEVAFLRPELANLIGLQGRRPDIVMRFGYGPSMPYAPRRPVASVLVA